MTDIIKKLENIDWDFSDYNSSRYPYDLNSIPWYPATFVPQIPKFLIASLTKPGDIVLDPFGGSGTTIVEALKLNRSAIYNDLNPFACDIISALLAAVNQVLKNSNYLDINSEKIRLDSYLLSDSEVDNFIVANGICNDVKDWYEEKTLRELLSIVNLQVFDDNQDDEIKFIRKLAVSSILKSASSQPGHFTYITDNCKPDKKSYKNAIQLYLDRLEQIQLAAQDFVIQFELAHSGASLNDLLNMFRMVNGDARNLQWIDDQSVDLVLTSPPYLCAQDYIKTMRLTNLLFPKKDAFTTTVKNEMGARCQRRGKAEVVVPNFYNDMFSVFKHIERVLKPDGFFCLVMGQGKGKITSGYNIIADLCNHVEQECHFEKIFHKQRNIGSRVIRIGGVDKEDIIIFRKKQ